jgi:glycosyltransferase involved in cell wall biosynthesis
LSAPRLPKDAWLVIAGTEGKDNIFRATNLEPIPPRVMFAGFVSDEDLPALYSGALALVYPLRASRPRSNGRRYRSDRGQVNLVT